MALSIYSRWTCLIVSLLSAAVWSLGHGDLWVADDVWLNFCLLCLLEFKGLIPSGHIQLSINVDLPGAAKLLNQLMININLSRSGHLLDSSDLLHLTLRLFSRFFNPLILGEDHCGGLRLLTLLFGAAWLTHLAALALQNGMTLRIRPILYVVFLINLVNHCTFPLECSLKVLRRQSTVVVYLKRGRIVHPQLILTLDHIIVQ